MKILVLVTHDDESDLATTVHASTEAAYRTLRDYLVTEYEMEPEAASDEMTKADIDAVTEAADRAALFTWSLTEHEIAEPVEADEDPHDDDGNRLTPA